jgi:mannose-6-phosphate isomerase-like protein (cupin superfamily)
MRSVQGGLALAQFPDLVSTCREGLLSSPFILAPGEQHPGAPPQGLGGPFIRIASRHTGGLMALGEGTLPPLTAGPHLHVHSREDEMFYVLEGVLTVQIGEELHDIAAGGLAWGARGTPHAFANRSPEPARIVIMWTPGGAEGVFAEMEAYRQSAEGTADAQAFAAIMASYGATTVGPAIRIPEL